MVNERTYVTISALGGVDKIADRLISYWLKGGSHRYRGVDLVQLIENAPADTFWSIVRTCMEYPLTEDESDDLAGGALDFLIARRSGEIVPLMVADAKRPRIAEYLASIAEDVMAATDPWFALIAADVIVARAGISPSHRRQRAALDVAILNPVTQASRFLAALRTAALGGGALVDRYLTVEVANTPDPYTVPREWYRSVDAAESRVSIADAASTVERLTEVVRANGPGVASGLVADFIRDRESAHVLADAVEGTLQRRGMLQFDPNTAGAIVGAIRQT
ncbi:hypothetical protein ACIQLK_05795 [Microbacterium sp. NPDC091382]|uniref:hypothetical protein n=1 Tax=Microbacterium sp. NPDC091382 TaxID=3364210 RepID=UPI00382911EB